MTADVFITNVKYAQALKSAIVSSIQSPPIVESNVRNLTVTDVVRRKLHSVHLQSGNAIVVYYTISILSTVYPADAYSQQFSVAVNSQQFDTNLQTSAHNIIGPGSGFVAAFSSPVMFGKYAKFYMNYFPFF